MVALAACRPASDVSSALLGYLKDRLELERLTFAEPPEEIPDGWEAQVFRFRLQGDDSLAPLLHANLIVRAYSSHVALARIRHEWQLQAYLSARDFPVPRPF